MSAVFSSADIVLRTRISMGGHVDCYDIIKSLDGGIIKSLSEMSCVRTSVFRISFCSGTEMVEVVKTSFLLDTDKLSSV